MIRVKCVPNFAMRCQSCIVTLLSYLLLMCGIAHASPLEGIQTYWHNLHTSPKHKQKLKDDLTRYYQADNLWDALREHLAFANYENVPAVREKINWYMNNPDYFYRCATRAAPYLYYISQQISQRHLPAELLLIPIIESGYDPFSLSNRGAAGIWQLMPETASGLGVKQDFWFDGRRDVIASTTAALNYLAYLQNFFNGNWLLALAAYNTGEGNVLAAIKRNIRAGRRTDFWSLPLAQQTRDYVPSILAMAAIIRNPERYPLNFPAIKNAPYLAQVDVGNQINLKYAANLAGLSYQQLIRLNPGFNRNATASRGPYKIVLPIENVEKFAENLARSPVSTDIIYTHYKVRAGDSLFTIARKFNTSLDNLRRANHLTEDTLRLNAHLLIPQSHLRIGPASESPLDLLAKAEILQKKIHLVRKKSKLADNLAVVATKQTKYTLQPGDTIYMTRPKDTLVRIAQRFHLDVGLLMAVNHLQQKSIAPGKQLIIPTHQVMRAVAHATPKQQLAQLYLVQRGDTLDAIAKRFHLSSEEIRTFNLMASNKLHEGEQLAIPTQLRG